ncbi:mitogen-activated protein kinase smk1 [Hanseniaspora vineae]
MNHQGYFAKNTLQNNQQIINNLSFASKRDPQGTKPQIFENSESQNQVTKKHNFKTKEQIASCYGRVGYGNVSNEVCQNGSCSGRMKTYEKLSFMVPEKYEIQQTLGKGSYGVVCSAVDKTDPEAPAPIAVKKITNLFTRDILVKRAIRELKFMRFFKGHKNIIGLVDLELVTEKPYDGLYCFQELIEYDLARVIHSSVQFSEFHIQSFLYQILCGVKYMHSADVIHRDLKPGNILCTIQGTLKICDFGLARGISSPLLAQISTETGRPYHITSYVATRWYRAPELILTRTNYSKAIDIWACGCILAEFYGRKPVFIGNDHMHQVAEIVKILGTPSENDLIKYGSRVAWELFGPPKRQHTKVPWSHIYPFASNNGLDLLEKLVLWDPEARLTVEQALEHPFFKNVKNPKDEPECPYGVFDFQYEHNLGSLGSLVTCLHDEVKKFKNEKYSF